MSTFLTIVLIFAGLFIPFAIYAWFRFFRLMERTMGDSK